MDQHLIDKITRGWGYEANCLPESVFRSSRFWALPYGVRRLALWTACPKSVVRIARLRNQKRDPDKPRLPTLLPCLATRSIFVHIPKAAGTSLLSSLYGGKTGDHRTIKDYQLCFSQREFESFFKFAFVRNPWDRLYSAFAYVKRGGRNEQTANWAEKHFAQVNDFEEFVLHWMNEESIRSNVHFRPQYEFLSTDGETIDVDFIGRFEDIEADFEQVRLKIGSDQRLPCLNRNAHRVPDYRSAYSDAMVAAVEAVYRKDIEMLGYDFLGEPADLEQAADTPTPVENRVLNVPSVNQEPVHSRETTGSQPSIVS